ncbi:MAG: phosphodiesterase [Peptococcaceae bacterium]|nr:phosphodiesterase [Peptococcaceae bacterium]
MKIMIASDIHGSALYCRKMLEAFDAEQADKLLLLGDVLYHGPRNPLPEEYDPKAVAAMLNERKQQILCVRGNCDGEVDQMMLEFPIMADYCILYAGKRMVFATHGHHHNENSLPMLQPGDVLLHGHTHIPVLEDRGAYILANPGSVTLPKQNSARGYLLLEDERMIYKTLEGVSEKSLQL